MKYIYLLILLPMLLAGCAKPVKQPPVAIQLQGHEVQFTGGTM